VSATAPPRMILVMPAFELGWESFLAGAAAVIAARATPLAFLPCFLSCISRPGRRVAVVVSVAAVAVILACARTRSRTHYLVGKVEPLAPFSPCTEPRRPARRAAVAFAVWLP
jgi:hypothetical protein